MSGFRVEGISGAGADVVFEMEIGTNRPDAMNHYGVAREAAAVYGVPFKALSAVNFQLSAAAKAADNPQEGNAALKGRSSTVSRCRHRRFVEENHPIRSEKPGLCPRFSARVIRGTRINLLLKDCLIGWRLLDQRAISNAVGRYQLCSLGDGEAYACV